MTTRKWIGLIIFFIVAAVAFIGLFYSSIQKEIWQEQKYVKSSLRDYFEYDTIDYTKKYTWDETYWIIKGKTKNSIEKYVVWQDLDILYSSSTAKLLTEEQLIGQLKVIHPNIQIKHIQPAYFRNVLCYEVQTISDSNHTLYSFYSMEDGLLMDQYTIPK